MGEKMRNIQSNSIICVNTGYDRICLCPVLFIQLGSTMFDREQEQSLALVGDGHWGDK